MSYNDETIPTGAKITLALIVVLAAIGAVVFFSYSTTVDNGEVAVIYDTWDGTTSERGQGWYMINPIPYDPFYFNVQFNLHNTVVDTYTGQGESQPISLNVAVRYQLDPAHVDQVFKQFKAHSTEDLLEICTDPIIRSAVAAVMGQYTFTDASTTHRSDVEQSIDNILSNPVTGLPACYLNVASVKIVSFTPSEGYKLRLEAKNAAQQEYEQRVIENNKSRADADTRFYNNQQDANGILIKAEAQGKAAQAIQTNLTGPYLEYLRITTWLDAQKAFAEKWQGQVPQYVMSGSSGNTNLWLPMSTQTTSPVLP